MIVKSRTKVGSCSLDVYSNKERLAATMVLFVLCLTPLVYSGSFVLEVPIGSTWVDCQQSLNSDGQAAAGHSLCLGSTKRVWLSNLPCLVKSGELFGLTWIDGQTSNTSKLSLLALGPEPLVASLLRIAMPGASKRPCS